jgi:hypothetical protein
MFIFYFVRLPLCNKYSDYIVTFISIHSVIIYVVFFGACMRCTRLCSLKPGCDRSQEAGLGCSFPMEVTENPSALEVATAENPVPRDSASSYPAPRVLPVMTRLGWVVRAATQPPRVLPVVIRLQWAVRAATQPPRVFERAPLLIPPWMSTLDLLLHILMAWQQRMLQMRKSP